MISSKDIYFLKMFLKLKENLIKMDLNKKETFLKKGNNMVFKRFDLFT